MSFRAAFSAFITLSLVAGALAAIGPVADLHIVDADIAPDGFTRPAVLAGGTFPGPLITGNKVSNNQSLLCCCSKLHIFREITFSLM